MQITDSVLDKALAASMVIYFGDEASETDRNAMRAALEAVADDLNERQRDELGEVRIQLAKTREAYESNIRAWHEACDERDRLRAYNRSYECEHVHDKATIEELNARLDAVTAERDRLRDAAETPHDPAKGAR